MASVEPHFPKLAPPFYIKLPGRKNVSSTTKPPSANDLTLQSCHLTIKIRKERVKRSSLIDHDIPQIGVTGYGTERKIDGIRFERSRKVIISGNCITSLN